MNTWHWQTWQTLPYLTCALLEDFPHGFFTQQFWARAPGELVQILEPTAQVYRVKQVHGNVVLSPSELEKPPSRDESSLSDLSEADGLVTEQKSQAVWACSADCTPVLIADMATGTVAAVHAGWRGTAAEIVPRAIDRLITQGSQLANLRIALGPAIAGEVYQVSTTVAAQVTASLFPKAGTETEAILAAAQQIPQSPILPDPQPGRVRLDVRRVNALQLERVGIRAEQVSIAPYCTYQTPEYFFSYRRDRQKKVQWSGIVSQNWGS
ncbi:MAG: peptidoglycan editing factor PgeF [Timaviella obliquedivisa GSE-PSE-MK23-08B]|nr:peptidoglycan editing factor PgeF [Timaviella obliquedivisa GSE-PSE-MK23-08B]